MALADQFAQAPIVFFRQTAAVLPQWEIRPDEVGMHNLHAGLRRFRHFTGSEKGHARDGEHPLGDLHRLKGILW